MAWYGVHVIMAVRFKDGNQDSFPAWENIYLIEATDAKEAENKAKSIGHNNEGDSAGTFQWNDRPAAWRFAGVRRIIEISDDKSLRNEPGDGVEVTYQTLEFDEEAELRAYADGGPATLRAID